MNNNEKVDYVIGGLFPIPTILIKFKQHDKYSNLPIMVKKDAKPKDWTVSLNTSFPNIVADDDFISMQKVEELKLDISNTIASAFKEINISTNFFFDDFWYNIYHQHQGQEPHNHLGNLIPYWCGIYYNKNASPTSFCREFGIQAVHQVSGWENSQLSPLFASTIPIAVEDGDILLFPPYLRHYVPSQEGIDSDDKMRVTFSFNLAHGKRRK